MEQQLIERIKLLKEHLTSLDWVNAKLEDLVLKAEVEGKSDEEIKQLRIDYHKSYQEIYDDRASTRTQIEELQAQIEDLKKGK